MIVSFDTKSLESYRIFLKAKTLPQCRFVGHTAEIPDEYASLLGIVQKKVTAKYKPGTSLFDYQRDIARIAIRKKKFAVFMEPGLGKTLIDFEFAHHAVAATGKRSLIVAPANVVKQMLDEHAKFYPSMPRPDRVRAAQIQDWIDGASPVVGITNYEAIKEGLTQGNLGSLILSESSMLKSMYGKWGQRLIELGHGLEYKLCETGTPAPNDRIEYGNHAVFLDQFNTLNAFLARYFVNRGQTDNRWELKPHALRAFYQDLSHWCIFVNNPATYGWKDNVGVVPPIHVTIHSVGLTEAQAERVATAGGDMFGTPGGITSRSKLSQLAKGRHNGKDVETLKPKYIRELVESWSDKESTIIWCVYNREQDTMEEMFPDAVSIRGETSERDREKMIEQFMDGKRTKLISKGKILGFGLNLQKGTRQVFSGLVDSYESYYQCVKRSNRIGSTLPLNVHLPVTEIERAMIDTVLRKADRVKRDAEEQEKLFKEIGYIGL